eukprot:CAMPEP_0114598964 /NCGR_PEP_ID=MMETSP0125-20121206/21407_1 /TAXON_ID=485358 ORGANISM="Aristerostoma sp., Strain ATCC 50986" /NCGR_SAMPLE_ID=MMETSP0125 /ASSEMBLY_ACC=CAM_ASM_000245 /LENGTH=44 /DNA_ID= /DNA_START= /DNA_END= /DNA_ORIENTATION=
MSDEDISIESGHVSSNDLQEQVDAEVKLNQGIFAGLNIKKPQTK